MRSELGGRLGGTWRLVVILTIVVVLSILALGLTQAAIDRVQIDATCTTLRANVQTLRALQLISDELGIPRRFAIPTLPPECLEG